MASLASSWHQGRILATSQPPSFPKGAPALARISRALQQSRSCSCLVVRAAEEQASAPRPAPKPAAKPVFSMTKGQIVRVDKEKYLKSVNYLSVGHPPYFKGLDYIYEDRGEVLDIRIFESGEYALIAWAGIPTAPAWLPTDMLIKAPKLNYRRT